MRIYYFGELIEDNENFETKNGSRDGKKLEDLNQGSNAAYFDDENTMKSVGSILKDLDMTIDTYRKRSALRIRNIGGHHYA